MGMEEKEREQEQKQCCTVFYRNIGEWDQEQKQEQWQKQAQTQVRGWERGRWPFSVPGRVLAATR